MDCDRPVVVVYWKPAAAAVDEEVAEEMVEGWGHGGEAIGAREEMGRPVPAVERPAATERGVLKYSELVAVGAAVGRGSVSLR